VYFSTASFRLLQGTGAEQHYRVHPHMQPTDQEAWNINACVLMHLQP
jgi:hypothetical protein